MYLCAWEHSHRHNLTQSWELCEVDWVVHLSIMQLKQRNKTSFSMLKLYVYHLSELKNSNLRERGREKYSALSLTSCVALDEWPKFSELRFPQLQNKGNNT